MKSESVLAPEEKEVDVNIGAVLRPKTWAEFVGQKLVVQQLKTAISAAKDREELPEHILFTATPGTGKTTLGKIVASELGAKPVQILGANLSPQDAYNALLQTDNTSHVIIVDELMKLKVGVATMLNLALEDYELPALSSQQSTRYYGRGLSRFLFIGSTTDFGSLPAALRDRFTYIFPLSLYLPSELAEIVRHSAKKLEVEIQPKVSGIIGSVARGTPRIANRILKRLRDYTSSLDEAGTWKHLEDIGIDRHGLDTWDRRYLGMIKARYGGGPVSLTTIAGSLGETTDTVQNVYEPFLVREGYVYITGRGRVLDRAKPF